MTYQKRDGLFQEVYKKVQQIPAGYVSTYGIIAAAIGTKDARKIGWALHANPDSSITPCHRVVTKDGKVSDNFAFGDYKEQKSRLVAEGVEFIDEKHVNLKKHLFVLT